MQRAKTCKSNPGKDQAVGLMLTAFLTDSKAMLTKARTDRQSSVEVLAQASGERKVLYTDISRTGGYVDRQ